MIAHDVLAEIKADPDCHDQTTWYCGTACCFAGHVIIEEYGKADNVSGMLGARIKHQNAPNDLKNRHGYVLVEDWATRILGLSEVKAQRLFYAGNMVEDLERLVNDYFG